MWKINIFIRFWSGTDRNSGHIPGLVPELGFGDNFGPADFFRTGIFRCGWSCFFLDRNFSVRLIFSPGRNFPVRCFLLAYIPDPVRLTGTGSGRFLNITVYVNSSPGFMRSIYRSRHVCHTDHTYATFKVGPYQMYSVIVNVTWCDSHHVLHFQCIAYPIYCTFVFFPENLWIHKVTFLKCIVHLFH